MSRLEDCCWKCSSCNSVGCGDRGDDCGCLDEPTCMDCHSFHWDIAAAELNAYADWLRLGMVS